MRAGQQSRASSFDDARPIKGKAGLIAHQAERLSSLPTIRDDFAHCGGGMILCGVVGGQCDRLSREQ
jgi:hypothetical protein